MEIEGVRSWAKIQLRNYYFKEKVFEKFNNRCTLCGTDGKKPAFVKGKIIPNILVIHHKRYVFRCPNDYINCEKCNIEHNFLEDCINDCVLLCHVCHNNLHENSKEMTSKWIPDFTY